MASEYIVNGGFSLNGEVEISGNKNAALPCLAATLLTDDEIILKNIPDIKDVRVMINLLETIGSTVKRIDKNTYSFKSNIQNTKLIDDKVSAVRGSILFAGPLVARRDDVYLSPPGGDVIGLRRLDTHFLALETLGVTCAVTKEDNIHFSKRDKLKNSFIHLDEQSVTATENIIMAASLTIGETIIYNAACEPHVQDLCNLLKKMGAEISGIGSNKITIIGKEKLKGADFSISSDYMEAGSFIGLAAATNGEILLKNVDTSNLRPLVLGFEKLGISFEIRKDSIFIKKNQKRKIAKTYSGVTPKLDDAPWPGFPADLLSIMCVVACQMEGSILIHEKMFESRMFFIDNLIRMGADIILCDPHRALIQGPTRLKAAMVTSPDVRAGMALVIAALCANGETRIKNIEQIERGYEGLYEKLLSLGAKIKKEH